MNIKNMNKKTIFLIMMQSVFIVTVSLFLFSGCTDTIEGEVNENLKPVIQFVNIPPDGQQFSRNPEVYWIGTDPDGLIDFYRYHIALESEVGTELADVKAYSATISDIVFDTTYWLYCDTMVDLGCTDSTKVTALDDYDTLHVAIISDWIQINIDQNISDPHTTNIIPLTADTLNPVSNPIPQYVFLQAFDREGKGSDIKWRLFSRNDNPPETKIFSIGNDTPYVNTNLVDDEKAGVITGVRLHWEGSDRKDYDEIGLTPPPFDYEWRLYGPYMKNVVDSIKDFLVEEVFVTEDAQVLYLDDYYKTCVTVEVDTIIDGEPTTLPVEVCDSIQFDSTFFADFTSSPYYTKQALLDVGDSLIDGNLSQSSYNGVDEWVQNKYDTLFNVYRGEAPDTTVEMNYIFWVRARDDAFVKDLVPEFVTFPVINPMYERDIAVIDFTGGSSITSNHAKYKHIDTAKAFWYNIIHNWGAETNQDIIFDTTAFTYAEADSQQAGKTGIDYIHTPRYSAGIPLRILLKHKVLILYNENYERSGFAEANSVKYTEILSALDAKINVWAAWRNPLNVDKNGLLFQIVYAPPDYVTYFGVHLMTYSNWFANSFNPRFHPDDLFRNEDFIGAYSIDETEWPPIDIDTALLHTRLSWHPDDEYPVSKFKPWVQWEDSLAALPEVNWAARSFGTEIMYLYKSKYGANHPTGLEYEGSPVGHRFESNLFRTVHFNFTLLTMDSLQAQEISNSVLNWLYDPTLGQTAYSENRYEDAAVRISIDEARQRYDERLIEQAERRLRNSTE